MSKKTNTVVGIAPARGGSQRLPNKNILQIKGKPLICYTIDAAKPAVDKLIVASDSDDILTAALNHDPEVTLVRLPESTATNKSKVLESICWVYDNHDLNHFDIIGMFLPTCPLRETEDIKNGLSMMDREFDGVISTTDYQFPPELGLVLDGDGYMHCFDKSLPWLFNLERSQDYKDVIRPNGAMYLKWTDKFERDRNFYKGMVKSYHMPRSKSIDIDKPEDVKLMEIQIELNKG
jgi:CMP-N-acetylneuraminic acid synthetase